MCGFSRADEINVGEALIQEQQVLAFKNPSQRPLATFRRYFFGGNRNHPDDAILLGPDSHLLDNERDLVALAPMDDDRLSSFLRDNFGCCCKASTVRSDENPLQPRKIL